MPAQQEGVRKEKRQRLPWSCDICRRKKVKCDSAEMPDYRCTNCTISKQECTHNRGEARGTEEPKRVHTGQEYVAAILSTSTIYIPPDDPQTFHQILIEVAVYARSLEVKLTSLALLPPPPAMSTLPERTPSPWIAEASDASDNDLPTSEELTLTQPDTGLASLSSKITRRFNGQSSNVSFAKAALKQLQGNLGGVQRPEFWTPRPWKTLNIVPPQHYFPQVDLLTTLVEIYFDQINPLLGVLHPPSFRQSLVDGLHLRDPQFGAVVLAVCSLASRYSDDPRVFLDEFPNSEHSCGWKWFRQVRPLGTLISLEPSLHQIQLIFLSTLYLCGTAAPEEVWLLTGLGIRFAQAAGAHHRSGYKRMTPLEAELYKRVFWMIVAIDTIDSSFRGRPRMSTIAELHLDLPFDADLEYLDMANPVQPIGKPSSSAFMIALLRLMIIFERIQGAYPTHGKVCDNGVVTDLDSELNKWVDAIPAHLRWDLHQSNQVFLDQSAALYTCYYHGFYVCCNPRVALIMGAAQIMIHRPFIRGPGKEASSSTSFPSLAICANAARSCGHVMDVQTRRGRGLLFLPNVIDALFDSAVVLLINVWSITGGRNFLKDFDRASADVHNCVRVLRLYERRWSVAGNKVDILTAMLNIGKYASRNSPSLKRPRDDTLGDITPESNDSQPLGDPSEPRPIAGSSRVMSITEQIEALDVSIPEIDHLFSLPLNTEELGRLPIYDPFYPEFPTQSENLHYQPQSHWTDQANHTTFMVPGLINGVDPAIGVLLQAEENMSDGLQLELGPPATEFETPPGDGWRDWSTYLANLEGLNHNPRY
ncbi:fungal-specific transcription factor domain-containing protein [Mycena crocata]|nr:fungal-specific transcription factor domain-containing protein [Mycena crocata]